jgi:hypothetical protein
MSDDWDALTVDQAIARLQQLKNKFGGYRPVKIPGDPSAADGGGAYLASQIAYTYDGIVVLSGPPVEDVEPSAE